MPPEPLFFPDAAGFRAWLEEHHGSVRERLDRLVELSERGERIDLMKPSG